MATLNFLYRGTKESGKLSVRLLHGTEIDYRVSSPIVSKKEYWFKRTTKKNGKTGKKHLQLKDLSVNKSADLKNHKNNLELIQKSIIGLFLTEYNKGISITKEWLHKAIKETVLILDTRTKINDAEEEKKNKDLEDQNEEEEIYNANLLGTAIQKMFIKYQTNERELKKYKVTHNFLLKYQKSKNQRFKIKDLNQDFADHFMNWSYLEMKYTKSYTNAQLKRLRASAVNTYENDENNIIVISKKLKTFKMFKDVYKDKIVVFLDYDELDKIDSTTITDTKLLDAKKAILLGCETGLRYSDLNKLVDTNIKNVDGVNYWKFRTEKTDTIVQITISDRILYLIDKYGIPQTTYPNNGVKLNEDIKKVCAKAKINESIKGSKAKVISVHGKKETRNIIDYNPKYSLITTRTFRRSFATNYYGKIDTSLITAITGHATEQMLRAYINRNDESNIKRTKDQMDSFHEARKEVKNNIKLTIIPKAI